MSSPNDVVNTSLREAGDDDELPEEFGNLDAIFNSQETSEEIKINVFALKCKFRELKNHFTSQVTATKQNSEAKTVQINSLKTTQEKLHQDVCDAQKCIGELKDTIRKLRMKTTMGNDMLWNGFETMDKAHHKIKQELSTKSALLRDYQVYASNVEARNAYLEHHCAQLLAKLKAQGNNSEILTRKANVATRDGRGISTFFKNHLKGQGELLPPIEEIEASIEPKPTISTDRCCHRSLDKGIEVLLKEKEEAIKELETTRKKVETFEKSQTGVGDNNVTREEHDALLNNYNKLQAELSANMPLVQQSTQTDTEKEKPGPLVESDDESISTDVSEMPSAALAETLSDSSDQSREIETKFAVTSNAKIILLHQKLSRIEQQLRYSKKEEQSLENEKATLVRMLQDSFKSKLNVQSEINVLNSEIKIMQSKIDMFEERAKTERGNYERAKVNFKRIESDLRKEQGSLETKLHDSRSQRDMLLRAIADYKIKISILAEENHTLSVSKRILEEEKRRTDKQNDELYLENKSLKRNIDAEIEDSLRIREDVLTSKRAENDLNKLVTKLTIERNNLKRTNHEYSKKTETLEERINDLKAKNDFLKLSLKQIDTDKHKSSEESYTMKISGLEDENTSLTAEKRQLQTTLQDTEEKLRIEKNAFMKCLESVEESENKILCTNIKAQQEDICKEKTTVEIYKTEVDCQMHEIKNLKTERENKNADIQDYLDRIHDLNDRLEETETNIRKYKMENADIKAKLKDTEGKLFESLSNEKRMQNLVQEMRNKIEGFKGTIIESAQHLEHAQSIFVHTPSTRQEEAARNFTDTLLTVKTNLKNIVNDIDNDQSSPRTTQTSKDGKCCMHEILTSFPALVSRVLTNLRLKESEIARFKQKIAELDAKYCEVFEELQKMKSQCESENNGTKKCTKCVDLIKRICELEARRDSMDASSGNDDTLESYRNHCDYLTKRLKQLEREKQRLQARALQLSEGQHVTDLNTQHSGLKNKYGNIKKIAVRRLTEQEIKSRSSVDPAQGSSTDP